MRDLPPLRVSVDDVELQSFDARKQKSSSAVSNAMNGKTTIKPGNITAARMDLIAQRLQEKMNESNGHTKAMVTPNNLLWAINNGRHDIQAVLKNGVKDVRIIDEAIFILVKVLFNDNVSPELRADEIFQSIQMLFHYRILYFTGENFTEHLNNALNRILFFDADNSKKKCEYRTGILCLFKIFPMAQKQFKKLFLVWKMEMVHASPSGKLLACMTLNFFDTKSSLSAVHEVGSSPPVKRISEQLADELKSEVKAISNDDELLICVEKFSQRPDFKESARLEGEKSTFHTLFFNIFAIASLREWQEQSKISKLIEIFSRRCCYRPDEKILRPQFNDFERWLEQCAVNLATEVRKIKKYSEFMQLIIIHVANVYVARLHRQQGVSGKEIESYPKGRYEQLICDCLQACITEYLVYGDNDEIILQMNVLIARIAKLPEHTYGVVTQDSPHHTSFLKPNFIVDFLCHGLAPVALANHLQGRSVKQLFSVNGIYLGGFLNKRVTNVVAIPIIITTKLSANILISMDFNFYRNPTYEALRRLNLFSTSTATNSLCQTVADYAASSDVSLLTTSPTLASIF